MTHDLIIGVGIIASIAAGLACAVAHWHAKTHRWGYVPRYVTGTLIGLIALAFPLFAAMALPDALALYGVIWLIFGVMGIATWLAHDNDPAPKGARVTLTHEADDLLRAALDEELKK
jgi:hypothetical protein